VDEPIRPVITLGLSADELDMVISSIDNARQLIESNEYATVMGFAKPDALPLLERLVAIRTRHDADS
jgi:hypothetical protein